MGKFTTKGHEEHEGKREENKVPNFASFVPSWCNRISESCRTD